MRNTARAARTLDLIGLKCPLPALRTRKTLLEMPIGALLEVRASDPLSVIDIPHLVQELGDRLISQSALSGVFAFVIERAGDHAAADRGADALPQQSAL